MTPTPLTPKQLRSLAQDLSKKNMPGGTMAKAVRAVRELLKIKEAEKHEA